MQKRVIDNQDIYKHIYIYIYIYIYIIYIYILHIYIYILYIYIYLGGCLGYPAPDLWLPAPIKF